MTAVLSLQKGGRLSLAKTAPGLTKVLFAGGWKPRKTVGVDFDLDMSAIALTDTGKVRSNADFCYYAQDTILGGAIKHSGDEKRGVDDGHAEVIGVDLAKIDALNAAESNPAHRITRIVFPVTIHEHDIHNQNFGQVDDAYACMINAENDKEIARFDLGEDASTETSIVFVELYLKENGWNLKAVGQGWAGGLFEIGTHFGLSLSKN